MPSPAAFRLTLALATGALLAPGAGPLAGEPPSWWSLSSGPLSAGAPADVDAPHDLAARAVDPEAFTADPETATPDARSGAAEATRIYLGMWTAHLRRIGDGLNPNGLIGVSHRGYFGATLVNSYGNRAVAAGIQRTLGGPGGSSWSTSVGYRLGLITGYDERLVGIARRTPALPFGQFLARLDGPLFGVEAGYAGAVVSLATSRRF